MFFYSVKIIATSILLFLEYNNNANDLLLHKNKQKKTPLLQVMFFWSFLILEKSEDFFVKNHEDKVKNPNNVETKDNSYQKCNNVAFLKTSDSAANPRCHRDNCKNYADKVSKTKVITFFSHVYNPPIFIILSNGGIYQHFWQKMLKNLFL